MSDTDRVAATWALKRVANELLLFSQAHEYQFDCMMKPERVLSGQCLNPSRFQDWFGATNGLPRSHNSSTLPCMGFRCGRDLALAVRYSNHSSADLHVDENTNKIRDDVIFGRAFVFPARWRHVHQDCASRGWQ